jgi:hypothetical protein
MIGCACDRIRTARAVALGLFLCTSMGVHAQTDTTFHRVRGWRNDELTLLVGYVQGRQAGGELGFARSIYGTMHHPFGFNLFVGSEISFPDKPLIGPKVGVFVTGGMAMGAQAIWYTDGTHSAPVLRPEIGIGIFKIKATYGYNFRIGGTALDGLNTHVFNLAYCFRLKLRSHTTFP